MTVLAHGRRDAQQRLIEEAEPKGANAVIAFRFDTSELGNTWTEICAYGTAVRARRSGACSRFGSAQPPGSTRPHS